jgi:inosine-uridine nucleoside N-ribohydrolase
MSIKVIHDTDIGSDIDDAVALAYLLANPECELLGVTTVSGDTVQRAHLASVLCKNARREVPIVPGKRECLLTEQKQRDVPQAIALDRWDHDTTFADMDAVGFLRRTIRAHPAEVVLLGTGPMSNIAALFAADEEVASMLKGLVLMIGNFFSRPPPVEWNALVDPVAAAIVFRARPPIHRSVGLDVTTKVTMNREQVAKHFQVPALRPVLDFSDVWFDNKAPLMTFHDPLAAACIFDGSLCVFEKGDVAVDLKSDSEAGATLWRPNAAGGRHEVAVSVQPQRFFDHYFGFFPAA